MKRPLIVVRAITWGQIRLWGYRKLVKWGFVKLTPTYKVAEYQGKAKKLADEMTLAQRPPIDFQHRDRHGEIGGPVIVTNSSAFAVVLEGPLIRRLVIPAGASVEVGSPVLEAITPNPLNEHQIIREWDALVVVKDMLWNYGNGSWSFGNPKDTLKLMAERGVTVRRK